MKETNQQNSQQAAKPALLKNSFWGIASSGLQNLFLSLFFVIIARQYDKPEFAQYLIANALYQLLVVFSTLGLSHWFIREIVSTDNKQKVVNTYFKTQLYFGITFFVINAALAFLLYNDPLVHSLALVFGFNIILDNLMNAIKSLNIAEFQQIKTFKILIIDSLLLCLSACILFIYPFSILVLSIIQVVVRFITINLFLKIGSSDLLRINSIFGFKMSFREVKALIYANWAFVIIGSISLLYWRSAQIIISKLLTLVDVAIYGIAYKIFQLALIVPFIISTTVYPSLVKKYNPENLADLRKYYQQVFLFYFGYGLLAFTFMYSFADLLIPLVFGDDYQDAAFYTKLMFITVLIYPTAILQANLLVAMKLEKYDMVFNLVSLGLYLLFTFVGLSYSKSLEVMNISIAVSFFIFHVLQDILLVKRGMATLKHSSIFYVLSAVCLAVYFGLLQLLHSYAAFVILWLIAAVILWFAIPELRLKIRSFIAKRSKQQST